MALINEAYQLIISLIYSLDSLVNQNFNLQIKLMKLKTPDRLNYSRYAKLCDQTFYHESNPVQHAPSNYQIPTVKHHRPHHSTYGFSSVSREKRGNFKFSVRLPYGQFTHYPNHHVGRSRSPSWTFAKREKYGKQEFVQYEVCHKSPLLIDQHLQMNASTSSIKELMKDKVKTRKSSSFFSHKENNDHCERETKASKNYSILDARQTSSVGFFNTTKINKARYISKDDLKSAQARLDEQNYKRRVEPVPKGYIEFHKRRGRRANNNSKGFETVLYSYTDQKQFDNYKMTDRPINPEGHIDMAKHLDRPDYTPNKLGPNTTPFKIDITRCPQNQINLILQGFRDRITTRLDRMEPQPNTRLDYNPAEPQLGGMVEMNRMVGRPEELFPIVDPAIKKAGDLQMKKELKSHIPLNQINKAHRPKNVQHFGKLLNQI